VYIGLLPWQLAVFFVSFFVLLIIFILYSGESISWRYIGLTAFPTFDIVTDVTYLLYEEFANVDLFAVVVVFLSFHFLYFLYAMQDTKPTRYLESQAEERHQSSYATGAINPLHTTYRLIIGNKENIAAQAESTEPDVIPRGALFALRPLERLAWHELFWLRPVELLPTINGDPFPGSFGNVDHDQLYHILWELIIWCIAIVCQIIWFVICGPLHFLVYMIFAPVWLVIGCILFFSKCLAFQKIWNLWFSVWTGTDDFNMPQNVAADTKILNLSLLWNLVTETLPMVIIQCVNNTMLGKWTPLAYASLSFSIFMAASTAYTFSYWRFYRRKPFSEIPVRIMGIDTLPKEHRGMMNEGGGGGATRAEVEVRPLFVFVNTGVQRVYVDSPIPSAPPALLELSAPSALSAPSVSSLPSVSSAAPVTATLVDEREVNVQRFLIVEQLT